MDWEVSPLGFGLMRTAAKAENLCAPENSKSYFLFLNQP